MPIDAELLELERGFWEGNGDYYRQHLADNCLVAFTEMAGVQDRESIAKQTDGGPRWTDVKIAPKGRLPLGDDGVIVTYEATASREGKAYRALVSSAYVREGGEWKLAFHGQTPLDGG